MVMYGKQGTNDASQTATSIHLEQPDYDHACQDVSYGEFKKPARTVGYGEVHSQ